MAIVSLRILIYMQFSIKVIIAQSAAKYLIKGEINMKCVRVLTVSRSIDVDEYEIIIKVNTYHHARISFYVDNVENILVPISIVIVDIRPMCGNFTYINRMEYKMGFVRAIEPVLRDSIIKRYSEYTSFTTDTMKKIIQDYTYIVDSIIDESYITSIKDKIYKFND